jgi:hypothetical protein
VLANGQSTSSEDVAQLVGQLWIDSENIWQNRPTWTRIWRALKETHAAMRLADATIFSALPDPFAVYRGVADRYYDTWRGLSWTLDQDKAHWFAQRLAEKYDQPIVLSGTIRKKYAFAYFTERNESEVVLWPRHIQDRKEEAACQSQGSHANA